jgi:hypothetical protein
MQDEAHSTTPSTPDATAATAQTRLPDQPAEKSKRKSEKRWPGQDEAFTLGQGVAFAVSADAYQRRREDPVYRPLKIYTVDPSTRRLEGATAVINVPYEELRQGPVGMRFAVETSGSSPFKDFKGVDLDDKSILIRSGRDPAPSDPAFHHQMVYAVCSSVYAAFRAALGRELAWAFKEPQLRVIPHAAMQKNAAYSRDDRSLSFGWYLAEDNAAGRTMPKQQVFACLSHDIVSHELTHAMLDGLRAQFGRSVSGDTAAFHEAFADLVALFQRFSYQEVVKTGIRHTGGRLDREKFPLQLAEQFGQGLGLAEGLRKVDISENPTPYSPELEIHALGSVLVSAVFEAFLAVYKRRSAGYFRLANAGHAADDDEPSSELVEILAHLLSSLASQFLSICIRAIDYCPPVNIMMGEYLRALITADSDLVPDDPWAYREALIEAFGRRRIYPPKVPSLGEDALLWHRPGKPMKVDKLSYYHLKFAGDPATPAGESELRRQACMLGLFVTHPDRVTEFGLAPAGHAELNGDKVDLPCIESVRSSRRVGPDGQMVFDLVAEITQCRTVAGSNGLPDFKFYGGSTVILDPTGEIRYIIKKSVLDNEQLQVQRKYELEHGSDLYSFQLCHLAREAQAGGSKEKSAQKKSGSATAPA